MASSLLTEDRRPALYGTLITCLILNNIAVASRLFVHYRKYYQAGRSLFLDDVFNFLSGVRLL